jgi:phosphatidylglycerophosphatase A
MKLPRAATVVASVFGIGYFSVAPGTIMSAIAVPLAFLLWLFGHSYVVVAGAAIIALVIGILACSDHVRETGRDDPSECVIDELAGQWVACAFVCFLPVSFPAFFLAFALFRLFDIWKPWPVSWAEDNLKSGLGVMMDDIVAGLMAGALAGLAHYFHLAHVF